MADKKHHHHKKTPDKLWLYGKHPCLAALKNPNRKCHKVLATQNTVNSSLNELNPANLTITDTKTIEKQLPSGAVHQGIAIEVTPLTSPPLESITSKSPLIILDQITDPHNVGAILRSAAAFNAAAIITTKHNNPSETATIAKSACGALETTPIIQVTNLASTLQQLKKQGYWCWGLNGHATDTITQHTPPEKLAIVFGAEGKGLRTLTQKHCDLLVKIPISNQVESINVSNAVAITLYQLSIAI